MTKRQKKTKKELDALAAIDAILSKLSKNEIDRALYWLAHKHGVMDPVGAECGIGNFDNSESGIVAFVKFNEGYSTRPGNYVTLDLAVQRGTEQPVVIMKNDAGIPIATVIKFDRDGLDGARADGSLIEWHVFSVEPWSGGAKVYLVESRGEF